MANGTIIATNYKLVKRTTMMKLNTFTSRFAGVNGLRR